MNVRLTDRRDSDYGNCAVCGAWCRGQRAGVAIGPLNCDVTLCFDCVTAHGGTQDVVQALAHLLRREDESVSIEVSPPDSE